MHLVRRLPSLLSGNPPVRLSGKWAAGELKRIGKIETENRRKIMWLFVAEAVVAYAVKEAVDRLMED